MEFAGSVLGPIEISLSEDMSEITIYTTATCPYCLAAKALLRKKNATFTEIGVDGDAAARAAMTQRAHGRRTVPQIFIGERHIGGCDDLHALDAAGELDPLLKAEQ
jgi:glutaredoxin 3